MHPCHSVFVSMPLPVWDLLGPAYTSRLLQTSHLSKNTRSSSFGHLSTTTLFALTSLQGHISIPKQRLHYKDVEQHGCIF